MVVAGPQLGEIFRSGQVHFADLIVRGAQGLTGRGRLNMECTAERLVHTACSRVVSTRAAT